MSVRKWVAAVLILAIGAAGWLSYELHPVKMELRVPGPVTPEPMFSGNRLSLREPGRYLVADTETFNDELYAYLIFTHVRSIVERDGCRTWLSYERQGKSIAYVIRLQPANDLLTGIPYLFRVEAEGVIHRATYRCVIREVLTRYERETQILDKAYNLPVRRTLERLPRSEQVTYLRRFIRFKAATDGRILKRIKPSLRPLSQAEAHSLAEDIVAVADFYSLPLDFFLGIGAMENNYLNQKGDLGHTTWKKQAQAGDVVVGSGPKGVKVLNESTGVWQITRETLRYGHALFLRDKRDYSVLPERLRPPKVLNLSEVSPEVLTTYAGLIFRDLLDRFHGDVAQAVGAYNGGPGHPNPQYEAGVQKVATYARNVLEHAAVLNGSPVAGGPFFAPSRHKRVPLN